ncbi:hypothetical protein [Brevundimonas sp.]|uniref:hypothetical protein n=1 Tax=Brevundimonas sp. TaxID=1871086 RepID=UPI003D102F91
MLSVVLAALIQINPGDPPGIEPGMFAYPWHVLESTTGGFGYRDQTSVRFYRVRQGREPTATAPYWMVHVTHDIAGVPGQQSHVDRWLDGRSCPAVAEALEALPREPFDPYRPDDIQDWGPLVQPHDSQATYTTYGRIGGVETEATFVDRQNGVVHRATRAARDRLLTCPEEPV